jgi:hypothetical protein
VVGERSIIERSEKGHMGSVDIDLGSN